MTRLTQRLAALSTFALLGVAPIAQAQTYTFFPNNTTINYAVNTNYSVVGFANQNDYDNGTNPTSPTGNLINGGSINGILGAYNSSTVNVSGGSVGNKLVAGDSSTVNLSGGSVSYELVAYDSSTINIFGRGLVAPLIDPDPNYSGFSRYSLSGTLLDGTILTNKNLLIQNGRNGRFTLNNVPAPGSLMVALIGVVPGVLILRRRR